MPSSMEAKSYCPYCGGTLGEKHVEGRQRLFCPPCNRPIYENPTPATCVVVIDAHAQVLLVKRSVPPKIGQWCLPGGFLELGEAPEAGALRELAEETGLIGDIDVLLGVRTTPSAQYHSVLMVAYLVKTFHGQLYPGDDAADARWFDVTQLPPIAFDSHQHFINRYLLKRNAVS